MAGKTRVRKTARCMIFESDRLAFVPTARTLNDRELGDQILDDTTLIDNLDRPADVRRVGLGVVDAEGAAERRQQVLNSRRVAVDFRAVHGRLAVGLPPLDAAAGEHGGPGVREV